VSACQLIEVQAASLPASPAWDVWNQTQAACGATFTQPGTGAQFTKDAFLWQNYTRNSSGQWDALTAQGGASYLVRFSAMEEGSWGYAVSCLNGTVAWSGAFTVVAGDGACRGFVRAASFDPHAFAFSGGGGAVAATTGGRYVPMGENNCWGDEAQYEKWWGTMAPMGANYSRIWLGFVSSFQLQTMAAGLGRLDLEAAWRLDVLLSMAAEPTGAWVLGQSLRLMISLYSYNILRPDNQYYGCWATCNPYVIPLNLTEPMQFFTDPRALAFQDRYHRYVIARYAWSPHVLSWELWNEVDGAENYSEPIVASWHTWASARLKALDTYAMHPVTTSFAQPPGSPLMDGSPALDYTQTHVYGASDFVWIATNYDTPKALAYGKPSYVGECGQSSPSVSEQVDPQAIEVLNGLLAPLFALSAGGSNNWWWDNWVDPNNLFWRWETPGVAYALALQTLGEATWNVSTPVAPAVPPSPSMQLLLVTDLPPSQRALLWVRNQQVTWAAALARNQTAPPPLPAVNVTLGNFLPNAALQLTALAVNSTFDPHVNASTGVLRASADGQVVVAAPANAWGAMFFLHPPT
jgi:hypothetical protein